MKVDRNLYITILSRLTRANAPLPLSLNGRHTLVARQKDALAGMGSEQEWDDEVRKLEGFKGAP